MLPFAIVVVVAVLALIFTPVIPRKTVGQQYLKKVLRDLGVSYPVPKECLAEYVERSRLLARFLSSSSSATAGFNQEFSEDLDLVARFLRSWTLESAEGEPFSGDQWSELVAIANKYGIPRGT